MNICRNLVFREILNEVRHVELRGEAFPALFFLIVWVGFTKTENPCDVPGSVFDLYLAHIFVFFKVEERTTS